MASRVCWYCGFWGKMLGLVVLVLKTVTSNLQTHPCHLKHTHFLGVLRKQTKFSVIMCHFSDSNQLRMAGGLSLSGDLLPPEGMETLMPSPTHTAYGLWLPLLRINLGGVEPTECGVTVNERPT